MVDSLDSFGLAKTIVELKTEQSQDLVIDLVLSKKDILDAEVCLIIFFLLFASHVPFTTKQFS